MNISRYCFHDCWSGAVFAMSILGTYDVPIHISSKEHMQLSFYTVYSNNSACARSQSVKSAKFLFFHLRHKTLNLVHYCKSFRILYECIGMEQTDGRRQR